MPKPIIGVGLCFYNDLDSLRRGMPTYANEVDYIFAIDGKFSLLAGDFKDYSEPEVADYVKSYPNVIYEKYMGLEQDKRQKYVDLAVKYKCDFLLIIDSDEYIEWVSWKLFLKNAVAMALKHPEENWFGVQIRMTPNNITPVLYDIYPRLWARPEETEYYKCHCMFRLKDQSRVLKSSSLSIPVSGMKIGWDDELRTTQYIESILAYQFWLMRYEQPIKEELRQYLTRK